MRSTTIFDRICRLVVPLVLVAASAAASAQVAPIVWKHLALSNASSGVSVHGDDGVLTSSGTLLMPQITSVVEFGPESYLLPGVYTRQVKVEVCDSILECGDLATGVIWATLKSTPEAYRLGFPTTVIQNRTTEAWSSFTMQLVDFGSPRTLFAVPNVTASFMAPFTDVTIVADNDHLFRGLHYSVVNFTFSGGVLNPGDSFRVYGSVSTLIPDTDAVDSFWLRYWGVPTTQGPNAAPPLPVPEPDTYAMMLLGLGVVGVMARRLRLAR